MLKHYINTALRNLKRQKGLAFINIAGLSVGLACFILFLLHSVNEFSYDRFHSNANEIFRVYRWTEAMQGEAAGGDVYLPMPLGPALKQDIPDVESFVRIQDAWGTNYVRSEGKIHSIPISFADPSFFSVFSFQVIEGEASPIKGIRDIVLTQKIAKQLFGNNNAVGKTIEIKLFEDFEPFTITGVVEDNPSNSTVRFDVLGNYEYIPTTTNGKRSVNNWNRSSYLTYIKLKQGSTLAERPDALLAFRKKYYPNEEAEARKAGYWTQPGPPVQYKLQPLRTMHTDTRVWGGGVPAVEPKTIWILLGIAAAVLLIACINFTTLAIGRSASRAREIGVRKVVGSGRKQLVFQFLAEALILTIFSVGLGLLLSYLLLPWFNELSGQKLSLSFKQFPELLWLLIGLTLVVGLLAGSYPALVLSGFKPLMVLKQKVRIGGANFFTRSLVTFQFILSIGLIASTIIILRQLDFMRSQHPGFNKENIVVVNASETDGKKLYPLFRQEVTGKEGISGIASSELGIGAEEGWSRSGFDYNGKLKLVFEYFVDPSYIPLMEMKLLTGRNFDPAIASDTVNSVIVNESLVRDFGWTIENAVGQQLVGYSETKTPVVIGVVKNFNFKTLKEEVLPQMFHQYSNYSPYKFFVKIKPGDPTTALATLATAWRKVEPELPFRYTFLDENIAKFYAAEVRWGRILGWAGGISVFLACLGLFGLAALAAHNRTKEIGIRKVLGASIPRIVALLSKDFMKLVLIALIFAAPLAWYFMNQWLQDFAYRISIGWWIFLFAGLIGIVVALLTVSFQAIKAAISNPVKSLRTE